MMSSFRNSLGLSLAILSLLFTISQSTCSDLFKDLTRAKNITSCKKLQTLGAEFGWNYQRIPHNNTRINVLFGVHHHENLKWVAWGVNPGKRPQMVGTRAIIGVVQENGTMPVRTYNITRYTKLGCQLLPSEVDISVHNMTGETGNSGGYTTLFATIDLEDQFYNISRLNHVWQIGFKAEETSLEPKMHPAILQNFDSAETINMTTGKSHGVGHHRHHFRVVHGILNIVGWGTLLPIGVIVARYFRESPFQLKKWYISHVSIQIAGYVIGTIGFGIGLGLGRTSRHYSFHIHRILAIFIFAFSTLQVLALRLRPKPEDKYREYWDMYHHLLGYGLLAAIGVNMFRGIAILKPNSSWKWAYIGILSILGFIVLGLELYTWVNFINQKKAKKNEATKTNEATKNEAPKNEATKNDDKKTQTTPP